MTRYSRVIILLDIFGQGPRNETVQCINMGKESIFLNTNSIFYQATLNQNKNPALVINMETPPGVDTIHHTYDIYHQCIEENLITEIYCEESTPITATMGSKKKSKGI